ncbi:MAG: NAD(P)/FAD-dependent oxidoreductase [Deltaproteobacteria bacterium]|nr:NAD(P)/FAD-dependent oxidoreductase [Candidatus Zymogenaceae bacterium]
MKKGYDADVVIVGGGTAGSFTAWRLAQRGYKVVVVEKHKRGIPGKHIGIFHMDEIRFAQFDIPLPEGKELIGRHETGMAWPPDGDITKTVRYTFVVMELPLFIKRLQKYAEEAGAEYLFDTQCERAMLSRDKVVGVKVTKGKETFEISAAVVVDASGVDAAVRTTLPTRLGIETDPVKPTEFLYVILQYWDDIPDKKSGKFPSGLNFYPFHKAFINPGYGDGAIVGIGQPERLELAEKIQNEFLAERFPNVKHTLTNKTWGRTPFRRPPFSLVGDGFVTVGDAAFMTKPFSGEGVTSGFTAAQIAVETIDAAIKKGDLSKSSLWPLNHRYFTDQGAKFAALFAQLPAAAELSRGDVNYLFKKDIIFSSFDFESMNRDFEVKMGIGRLISVAAKLITGRMTGGLSKEGFKALLSAMGVAGKIKKHYEAYPKNPADLPAWEKKAKKLWGEG